MWLLLQNINYAKENKTMKLQKQIILDNVDKVKAFVVTVSKYPGDATLVSGRYVVDAKSIMGIFSLALNQPIDFTYEGELAADLAKEVQVYESQEV
jgi:phosphotransferase system HPr-like phosphotransfer protein